MDLSRAPIRLMEPAIVERLRLAFPASVFQIERVPPTMTLTEFKRLVKLTPFIGLAWVGAKPDPESGRSLKGSMLWRLILVYKASSGLEARFKGDAKGIGLDAMCDVAAIMMHGVTFPGIGSCAVTSLNAIVADGFTDDDVSLAQIDFQIQFMAGPGALALQDLVDFKTLAITWAFADDPDADTISDTVNMSEDNA
jgi:hypothetical protein